MTANQSALIREGKPLSAFALDADATAVSCNGNLDAAYSLWRASKPDGDYQDTHCSVMTPASFELLIRECQHLGLLSFEIESISQPNGCEFYVHLVNRPERNTDCDRSGELPSRADPTHAAHLERTRGCVRDRSTTCPVEAALFNLAAIDRATHTSCDQKALAWWRFGYVGAQTKIRLNVALGATTIADHLICRNANLPMLYLRVSQ